MSVAPTIVRDRIDDIQALCREHNVSRLELFGSALTDRFKVDDSDLDFLVEFVPVSPANRANAYFNMLAGLQDIFHRKIDLVETAAITNPYFKKSVNETRTVLYAA